MNKELFKKLGLSFAAFGVSAEQAKEAMQRTILSMRAWEKRLIELQHQSKCVMYANTLAVETCPVKRQIIWSLFKQL